MKSQAEKQSGKNQNNLDQLIISPLVHGLGQYLFYLYHILHLFWLKHFDHFLL